MTDYIVRYSGGNNAGRTIISEGIKYSLHLLPSGILRKDKICILANGVVINPAVFLQEMDYLNNFNIDMAQIFISDRAHVVMPWHIYLDNLQEQARGKAELGTTKRGNGPAYADKANRSGIRMGDLVDPEYFKELVHENIELQNDLIVKIYGGNPLDADKIIEEYSEYAKRLKPYVRDVNFMIHEALEDRKIVLFEGSQATLLDMDFGTYPYVTSSNPIAGGVCTGAGVGPKMITEVLGVVKAYVTRLGAGPFVTEQDNEIAVCFVNMETNTDLPQVVPADVWLIWSLKYSARINGLTGLCMNHIDTIGKLDKIACVAYKLNGETIDYYPSATRSLICVSLYMRSLKMEGYRYFQGKEVQCPSLGGTEVHFAQKN